MSESGRLAKPSKQGLTREFSEFLAIPEGNPDHEQFPAKLRAMVQADLSPSFARIAQRLGVIHLLAGAVTLLVCPQFGIGPLGGGEGLMGIFMKGGELACAIGCGSFFTAVTAVISLLILNRDERRAVRTQGWRQYLWLVSLSWAAFMVLGEAASASLTYIVAWSASAVAAGVLVSRLGSATPQLTV